MLLTCDNNFAEEHDLRKLCFYERSPARSMNFVVNFEVKRITIS